MTPRFTSFTAPMALQEPVCDPSGFRAHRAAARAP
jgi:hypothetical protein